MPLTTALPHNDVPRNDVLRSAELRASGFTAHAIATRCRPSGPWQRVFPGVILLSNSPPSRRQRLHAVMAYAGGQAVLTGTDAIRAHGLPVAPATEILILIPATRRLSARANLTVERTTRLPPPVLHDGLPMAPLVRATVDAARHERDRERLRSLLFTPIQHGKCTLEEIHQELNTGNQRGTAAIRTLLDEETQHPLPLPPPLTLAERLLHTAPLPPPTWQTPLHTKEGAPLGVADAWWPEPGLAWSVGATRHNPLPTTEQSRPQLTAAGVTLLHTDPNRLRSAPRAVLRDLVAAFSYAATNPHRPDPPTPQPLPQP